MKKFKNGDKVVIKSKSYWGPLKNSSVWKNGKDKGYWYFIEYIYIPNESDICIVGNNTDKGDYFLERGLELYDDKLMKVFKSEDFEL